MILMLLVGTAPSHADVYSVAKVVKVVETLLSSSDKVRAAYTTAWSETLYDQLEDVSGRSIPKEELQRPLEHAARRAKEFRRRLGAIAQLKSESERLASLEGLAEDVMRERWGLALTDARHHVALTRQQLIDRKSGGGVYGSSARRLLRERDAVLRSVETLLESAKADGRTDAWELWADFADSALQAGFDDGVPTQLDSFLKASVVEYIDPQTGERTRYDMASLFEPLTVVYPSEKEENYPEYPRGGLFEIEPPGIIGVLEVRSSVTRDAKATAELLAQFRRDYGNLLDDDVEPPTGPTARVLVAFGHDIVAPDGSPPRLTESDPWIDYRVIHAIPSGEIPTSERKDDAFRRLRKALVRIAPKGAPIDHVLAMDHVIVLAEPRDGAVPGLRKFKLGAHEGEWFQDVAPLQGAAGGTLHIRRVLPSGDIVPINHIFPPDHLVVEIRLDREIEANEIDVTLARSTLLGGSIEPVDADGSSGVMAHRTREDSKLFRSRVLQIWDRSKPLPAWAGRAGAIPIGVYLRESLLAAVHPSSSLIVFPTQAAIQKDPGSVGHDWARAVRSAARLGNKKFDLTKTHIDKVVTIQAALRVLPGDQSVPITTGDHAALTLLRSELRRRLMAKRNDLGATYDAIRNDDDEAVRWFCGDLKRQIDQGNRALALMPITGDWFEPVKLGDLFISEPWPKSPKLRKLYIDTARSIAKRSLELTQMAIERCGNAEEHHYAELIDLAGLGTRPIADRIVPDAVYLVEVNGVPRWERHKLALQHLHSVGTLYLRFATIEDYASKQMDLILLVATAGTVGAELLGARLTVFCLEGTMFGITAYEKIPAYFASVDEVKFATAAGGILAHDRIDLAEMREGSLVLTSVEVLAGGLGSLPALHKLVLGTRLTTHARTAEIIFANGPKTAREVRRLPDLAKAAVIAVVATDVKVLAKKLSPKARRAAAAMRARLEKQAHRARLTRWWEQTAPAGAQASAARAGYTTPLGEGVSYSARDATGNRVTHLLGERIGAGNLSVVYASRTAPDQVVKLLRQAIQRSDAEAAENATELLATHARISSQLEKAGIPHLKHLGGGRARGPVQARDVVGERQVFFAIQERLPAGAMTLRYRRVPRPGAPSLTKINGVQTFPAGEPLPWIYQHAILRLFKKLGRAGLVAEDLHLENLYFFKSGVRLEAGILDLDRIARFGARGEDCGYAIESLLKFKRGARFIRSMHGVPELPAAQRWHNMIDAEFFMQKILEHKNYVEYDPADSKWYANLLELDIVERYFPGFRAHKAENLETVRASRNRAR